MANQDGKVIIDIDSNAQKVARDFEQLDNATAKYERILKNVQGTSNASLPIYDKIRTKLKEQRNAANNAITAYQKLANVQKSGVGFNQLNSVTGSAIDRLKNLALQGRQNSQEFQKLANAVKNANKQLNSADNVVNKAIGSTDKLGLSLSSLGRYAGAAGVGFAALKLKDYTTEAIKTAAAFEQLGISFQVMTGSAQLGQQLTDQIIELANVTPMTAQSLSKNAQMMLSFGQSVDDIIPNLKMLGDISGGDVNRMNSLTLAFSQVGASGRLMGQDVLQMINAGFNPLEIMSKKTGKSMGELRKEMEEGKISFQMVKQAMIDATSEGGRYYGLMEAQSKTLNGLLSTNADAWGQVAKNIGDIFMPAAKGGIEWLIKLGKQVQKLTDKLTEARYRSELFRQEISELNFTDTNNRIKYLADYNTKLKFSNQGTAEERNKQIAKNNQQIQELISHYKELKALQSKVEKQSGTDTDSVTGGGTSQVTRQKDAFEKLQAAVPNARREVELNAIAYGTSSPKVQEAFTKYRDLNTQLSEINKLFDENTKKVKDNGGAYAELQTKIREGQDKLLDMAVLGQTGTIEFTTLKNEITKLQTQATNANNAVSNSVGVTWSNISQSISSQLSQALTTPLREGENAFQRFGNVALNVIQQIAQSWLSNGISNLLSGGSGNKGKSLGDRLSGAIKGGAAGSAGGWWGAAAGAIGGFFKNADGNAFYNGNVIPFAKGGVVSQDTYFPMRNGRTGLMGEKGAEAIMPLKRTTNGQLGVQATAAPANVNIYNQSGADIETVQRPDGETDIFIKRVNSALRSERTQAGFSSALQRNQSRGVQAS